MKKISILIVLSMLIALKGNTQNPDTPTIFYFTYLQADSTVFARDTLYLTPKMVDVESPRFMFDNNSRFVFLYNVKHDTLIKLDPETGLSNIQLIAKSDSIKAKWESEDLDENVKLTFSNDQIVEYSIKEDDLRVYFIKKE